MSGIYYSKSILNLREIHLMQENDFYYHMMKSMTHKLSEFIDENAVVEIKDLSDQYFEQTEYKLTVAIMSPEEYKRLKEIERIFYKYTDLEFLLSKENKQ